MRIRNVLGTRFSGKMGKDVVAVSGKGRVSDYLREYVKPKDPKSELQDQQRGFLRQAVAAWRRLPAGEQVWWDAARIGKSGYNLFVKEYILAKRQGRPVSALKPPRKRR